MSRLYNAYRFIKKDPAIDELRTILQDSLGRRFAVKDLTEIEENGGPSVSAMQGWFFGKVRRPQSATLEACGRAIGYRRVWVKNKEPGGKG